MPGEAAQLFVGNLVQAMDVAAVVAGELLQPDVGALGDEHGGGHPFLVGAEALGFLGCFHVGRHFPLLVDTPREIVPAGGVGAGRIEPHPDGDVLFLEHVDGQQKLGKRVADQLSPVFDDVGELAAE